MKKQINFTPNCLILFTGFLFLEKIGHFLQKRIRLFLPLHLQVHRRLWMLAFLCKFTKNKFRIKIAIIQTNLAHLSGTETPRQSP